MAFEDALANTLGYEGGSSDSQTDTGGATINGISSKWWPEDYALQKSLVDAGDTDGGAAHLQDFYKKNFWDKIGADNLPPQIQNAAFDTAVNNGVPAAQKMIAQAGDDPNKLLDLRQQKDTQIAQNNPAQTPNEAGWQNRINDLRVQTADSGQIQSDAPQGDHLDQILDQAPQAAAQAATPPPDHLDSIIDNAPQQQPQQKNDMEYRFAEGLQDPLAGEAQALANIAETPQSAKAINDQVNQREATYQAQHSVPGVDWARFAGSILSPANALLPLKSIAAIDTGGSALARVGKSMLTGTTSAMSQPTETSDDMGFAGGKAQQAAVGSAITGTASSAGNFLASLIKPQVSDDASKLIKEGVPTSMGQTSGDGWLKSLEDKATSFPVIGGLIKAAQANGVKGLNIAAVNRSLAPIGKSLPDNVQPGNDAIAYAQSTLGKTYDDILPQISGDLKAPTTNNFGQPLIGSGSNSVQPQDFATKVGALLNSDYYDMHPDMKGKLQQILQKELIDRINPDGTFNGDQAKTVENRLNFAINKYSGSMDSDSQMVSDALGDIKSAFRDQMTSANPEAAAQLQNINRGYANFKITQKAASSVNAPNGVFTPAQLHNAVQAADKSVSKGNFANGTALMQDLSQAGKNVLPNKVPDSGTAGRTEIAALAAAGAMGGVGAFLAHPVVGTTGGALAALYTSPGQALMRKAMTARPQAASALSDLVKRLSDVSTLHPYAQ